MGHNATAYCSKICFEIKAEFHRIIWLGQN